MRNHRSPQEEPFRSARLVVALCFTVLVSSLTGQTRLHRIFGDHMVLQRDRSISIRGWSEASVEVTVRFGGQKRTVQAADDGSWSVTLDPMAASADGRDLVVHGSDGTRHTVTDVVVGDVWVCGGQSNMEWVLRASRDADIEIPSADLPRVRFVRLPKIARSEPLPDFPTEQEGGERIAWRPCTPEYVAQCTAVGYYFGRRLSRRLGVPIGLVDTSWGGTLAQHWVPTSILRPMPEMKPDFERFEARVRDWVDGGGSVGAARRRESDLARWEAERSAAREAGTREPRKPRSGDYEDPRSKRQPGGMYNGIIAPLASLAVRGVLFYQGENNSFAEAWKPFPKTYPAVVASWRQAFGDPGLPFGLIQIAGWSNRRSMTYDMNHHTNIVREVQHLTWERTSGTGLIVTFDTNSNQSIHPGRKLPVGERSARWALAEVYGLESWRGGPLEWRGPVYKEMTIEDARAVVRFEDGTARGLRLDQDAELGFYVAGADREFHVARARVRKQELEVWSESVPEPVAVRYGWSNLPLGSLMNGRELPAYPFRSDDWPLLPHQSTGAYRVDK